MHVGKASWERIARRGIGNLTFSYTPLAVPISQQSIAAQSLVLFVICYSISDWTLERGWGESEGKKIMSTGLSQVQHFSGKKGKGVRLFGRIRY